MSSELFLAADPRLELRKYDNSEGTWSLLSRTEVQDHLYVTAIHVFLFPQPVTCNREEKIHFSFKNLTKFVALPSNGAKIFVRKEELNQARVQSKPFKFLYWCSNSKYVCRITLFFRITIRSKSYSGSYLQGGLAIEAFKVCIEIFVNEGSSLF